MYLEELLEKAIFIAVNAHHGQKDKANNPYILHPLRVMFKGVTTLEKICGVLHDVVEDTDWTLAGLTEQGFPGEVIAALELLTKGDNESYDHFINRVVTNEIARNVKINDLEDNMNCCRLLELTTKDSERINKYIHSYRLLIALRDQ